MRGLSPSPCVTLSPMATSTTLRPPQSGGSVVSLDRKFARKSTGSSASMEMPQCLQYAEAVRLFGHVAAGRRDRCFHLWDGIRGSRDQSRTGTIEHRNIIEMIAHGEHFQFAQPEF